MKKGIIISFKEGKFHNTEGLIDFIESCDPDDAALIVSIKDKKMPYPNITERLFKDAWPTLASTWILPKEVTIKENV